MMLSLDTAYRSFGGEVEASSTPTICRLPDSRRHQLSVIARAYALDSKLALQLLSVASLVCSAASGICLTNFQRSSAVKLLRPAGAAAAPQCFSAGRLRAACGRTRI
jgi:hypothetical protein